MPSDTILVIGNDPQSRDLLTRGVKEIGYSTVVVGSLPDALALVPTLRPQAIMLDIDDAEAGALDLLHQLRLESPEAPLVVVSGTNDARLAVKAVRAGACDFLVKPVPVEALRDAIQRGLAQNGQETPLDLSPAAVAEVDRSPYNLELLFRGSERIRAVEDIVHRAADTNVTVLLTGESGVGKEMVARAIHQISGRLDKPFVKVNCASLPAELLESELFGHEKGAFTGAHRRKPGKFELAHQGTFLLDEIGEMPLSLQAKLLHVLQDAKFFSVGGTELITADVRLIAATNSNLAVLVANGQFREDLYYRLNVVTIPIPPLRTRREEIPSLVRHFLGRFCKQYNRSTPTISPETMRLFQEYSWPGNVRELENMIRRLVVLQSELLVQEEIALRTEKPQGGPATPAPLAPPRDPSPARPGRNMGLKEIAKKAAMAAEAAAIKEVLERVRWNRAETARLLKISYKALLYKIRQCGLDSPRSDGPGK
jgi:two-component system, NtrC family, response regulator AtoC